MSWIAVREVLELDLPPTEKFVLIVIANFSNDKTGTAWPSQSTIARLTNFRRQTVNRAIKRLCDKKVLVSSRRSAEGKSTSNVYRINIVTLSDIQVNNVAQNDNQVSNSETIQCNGELHKPLLTLNEPLNSVTSANKWNSSQSDLTEHNDSKLEFSGPPKTPAHFLSLLRSTQEHFALNKPDLMAELKRQGLEWDRFDN